MIRESLNSKKLDDDEIDKDTPLSDEEISRLIQASRETSFKRKEIKKEMAESFKKVSLHDIAKKYSKEVFSKSEPDRDIKQNSLEDENTNTKVTNVEKENKIKSDNKVLIVT